MLGRDLAALGALHPRGLEGEFDVLPGGQPGEQGIALEDHAAVEAGPRHRHAVDQKLALVEILQPGDDGEQRALAAARGADEGDELVLGQGQIDVMQGLDLAGPLAEGLAEAAQLQLGRHVPCLWL